jgi:hypothetical protein
MDQLLVMLVVPPIVGVITYAVIHLISKRGEEANARTSSSHQFGEK